MLNACPSSRQNFMLVVSLRWICRCRSMSINNAVNILRHFGAWCSNLGVIRLVSEKLEVFVVDIKLFLAAPVGEKVCSATKNPKYLHEEVCPCRKSAYLPLVVTAVTILADVISEVIACNQVSDEATGKSGHARTNECNLNKFSLQSSIRSRLPPHLFEV